MSIMKFADIGEQCKKENQLKREDITKVAEWQIMQPHLPSPIHPMETVCFLHACSYSIEAAKHRIDAFYTFRTHYRELFFTNLDPFEPELQLGRNTFIVTTLPELSPDGYMILFGHLLDSNPDVYNFNTLCKMVDMIVTLSILQRGPQNGIVSIINMEGITLAHLLKWNAISLKAGITYLRRIAPIQLKTIHFVNCVPFMDRVMALLKPFMGKGFTKKVFFHYGDNASIFKFVPKNILPIECGGESFCAEDYFKTVMWKDVECYSEFFKNVEGQLVDEAKRLVKPKLDKHFFGVEGTFKKLVID